MPWYLIEFVKINNIEQVHEVDYDSKQKADDWKKQIGTPGLGVVDWHEILSGNQDRHGRGWNPASKLKNNLLKIVETF